MNAPDPALAIAPDAPTVLIVDDEDSNLTSIEKIFQKDGLRALTAHSAREALDVLRQHRVDVVLTDLMMPAISGLELLKAIKQIAPDVEVVMMTAYGTVETAVQAMREGAYDFVEKPLKRMNIVKTARKAAERRSLTLENRQLKSACSPAARSSAPAPRCGACSTSRYKPPLRARPCSYWARAAPAKSCSRASFTSTARVARPPSWP
jgi:DNA-binding NtrC family response regulator